MPPKVILVGPMGAGKSTVGQRLAHRLGVTFRDTDADIAHLAGKSVQDIFVEDGESAFRAMERDAVASAISDHDGILSLGGGAILDPATREHLDGQTVVFLNVGLADAVKRVGLGHGRPLLVGNVRATIKKLLDERAPIYNAVATYVVETDGRDTGSVVAEIEALLVDPAPKGDNA
ncbi:shikimate kinase [Nocardioides baekrokdamisoli]|uniref:Shikimate kinase n=1 Tax=Nocardioides baekrokdamisoli TaxID=1804624 RepID=A0A3G9IBR2_9ACTN|nr:shikimate kinase [Nocardioides baekrokdamisoli]BBH16307.1 shikimate kinase [Nocardioides baekrokdamisoli]